MLTFHTLRRDLPVIEASVRTIAVYVLVLRMPWAAAQAMDLCAPQTGSWILPFLVGHRPAQVRDARMDRSRWFPIIFDLLVAGDDRVP